jgi:hypothetical protein
MDFLIKENRHFSKPRIIKFWRGRINTTYVIQFEPNCEYNTFKYPGINKLMGFSFFLHGEKTFGKIPIIKNWVNSILVGYKSVPGCNKMALYIYKDHKGVETRKFMTTVEIGKPFTVQFKIFNHLLQVDIVNTDNLLFRYRGIKSSILWGYRLQPYFGGKRKAPHNMNIMIYNYEQ